MITILQIPLKQFSFRRLRQGISVVALLPVALMFAAPIATAVHEDPNVEHDGITIVNGCMDDLFLGDLGCTANDVRVSGVADVATTNPDGTCLPGSGPDGIVDQCDITFAPICDAGAFNVGDDCSADPNICLGSDGITPAPQLCGDTCAFPGDDTTFSATFEVVLGAQARYDIGLYFAIDGDDADDDGVLDGDGALFGTCSISTLPEVGSFTRPLGSTGDFVDLDTNCKGGNCPQPEDLCGDIDSANSPIFYDLGLTGNYITTECIDPDGNGKLNLPNCTSWRQSGANEVCLGPDDAFPGSPSKCNCDPTFEVPINVPAAELLVEKTADPTSVDEPSETVTFTVAVTNTGVDPNNDLTLNSLGDDIYGNLDADDIGNHTWLTSDCLDDTDGPVVITPGGTYTCSFTATVAGNGGGSQTDVVLASGTDDQGNTINGSDDATVAINDVQPAISVTKTANPESVMEGAGESVTFTVIVNNDSVADSLTLTSLTDAPYGDLNGQGSCSVPQTIALGGSYSCSFSAVVDGQAFTSETDTVTAVGSDDEGNSVNASDSATVDILDDIAAIELIKTVNGVDDAISVYEPGEQVTYEFTINNLSSVDTVTINSLTDTIYGNLSGQGTCSAPQVLSPLGSYSCSILVEVGGNAGESVMNKATAVGVDDDGQPVMASDDATVNFLDVPPAASLTKTPTMVTATFEVHVTNDSGAEALTLDSLNDNQFGDITQVQGNVVSTGCSVPQDLPVGGSYTCTFEGKINTSPHTDTVTGSVSDNDGGSVSPTDSATVTFQSNP